MKAILAFIQRYHFFLLFLLIEIVCLTIVIRSNKRRSAIFIHSANALSGAIYQQLHKYTEYFSLKNENMNLARENARLRGLLGSAYRIDTAKFQTINDTVYKQQYTFLAAQIVKNSVDKQNNYITINKGRKQNIEPDMAVISSRGVVGVIGSVSDNYCIAISLLNTKIGISAKIRSNDYYGSLIWDGADFNYGTLKEIPNHVTIHKGDSIVTSSYSAIFPEGILIGQIADFKKNSEDNFYTIKVRLATDFKNVNNVYIIKNLFRKEQLELEKNAEIQFE